MPVIRAKRGHQEGRPEHIQRALLRVIFTELHPTGAVKHRPRETTLATAKEANAVLVCLILTWSEPILVLRALATAVDPWLGLRLATRTPVVYLVGLHADRVGAVLCNLRERFMGEPLALPGTGKRTRLGENSGAQHRESRSRHQTASFH